jgi:hypothetical protein
MSTLRYLFLLGLGLAFVPFACAQSNETDDGDTDPSSTTSASGGSAGAGGAVGGAGAGGTGACAIDCSTVSTTQCTEAVCNDGSHPGTVGQCVIIDLADATPVFLGVFDKEPAPSPAATGPHPKTATREKCHFEPGTN